MDQKRKLRWQYCALTWAPLLSIASWLACATPMVASDASESSPVVADQHDGSHDFDFLIGNWKAHVRRLPERLVGSHTWVEYDGISNHKKLLDSNANFEDFEVD